MSMKGEGFVNKAIRGLVFNDKVRILAINSTNLVKDVTKQLQTTPCASAALGRTMSIVSLIGLMQKNEDQVYAIIDGNGPIGKINTHYMGNGKIRGYVDNPQVDIFTNEHNKLDVKKVVGNDGFLNITIKQNLKNDYHGSVPLVSGEISEDFTYYFSASEQIPSAVSAGVLVDKNNEVLSAGAIIIQMMPLCDETDIEKVESILPEISQLSSKLLDQEDIEKFINSIFDDFKLLDEINIEYSCTCSYEDMQAKIATLSIEDLNDILIEDQQLEAVCPWCNSKYLFDEKSLKDIISLKEQLK